MEGTEKMVNVTRAENQPCINMDQDNPAVTTNIKNKKASNKSTVSITTIT
jgi:hypothetical protein